MATPIFNCCLWLQTSVFLESDGVWLYSKSQIAQQGFQMVDWYVPHEHAALGLLSRAAALGRSALLPLRLWSTKLPIHFTTCATNISQILKFVSEMNFHVVSMVWFWATRCPCGMIIDYNCTLSEAFLWNPGTIDWSQVAFCWRETSDPNHKDNRRLTVPKNRSNLRSSCGKERQLMMQENQRWVTGRKGNGHGKM